MRTVRSAARARNRSRAGLACLLVAILLGILVALTAPSIAAPASSPAAPPDARAGAGSPLADGPGALDDGPGALDDGRDERADAGLDDAGDQLDAEPARPRPSRWGRLELAITWRRALDDAAGPSRRDELWLLAIWSR